VTEDYDLHWLPGWRGNTAGYHIDDGNIFDADINPAFGKEGDGKFPRFLLAIKQVQFKYVYIYTHFMSVLVYEKSVKPVVCFSVGRDKISELESLVS
jgi:hypothetical protein